MEALYLLVPLSIGIVFAAIRVFFWMSDSGQFDDMVGPGLRMLDDDDITMQESTLQKHHDASSIRKQHLEKQFVEPKQF